jgi:hypothetical protein
MGHRFRNRVGAPYLALVIAEVWTLLAPPAGQAQESPDLFLLDVQADGYVLAESVPAYAYADTYVIDFALFLEALEFPIERADPIWSGWFRSEDRQFTWNMGSGFAYIGDLQGDPAAADPVAADPVAADEWLADEEGIYVAVAALERWFGLALAVDSRLQTLRVDSSEPLPFQVFREQTLARYRYRAGRPVNVDVVVPDRYAWATVPMFNFSTHVGTQRQDDVGARAATASLVSAMDLLKHSVVYSGTRSSASQLSPDLASDSTHRLTIERASATQHSPLFAGAHSYVFGDIYQVNSNLVASPYTGRGFSIDRYPQGRASNLGEVTIAGNASPGWEAELYRNGALVEFATVGVDGRYLFPNQQTPFGPQGQTREERHTFWGAGTELEKGDYDFSISHIDFSRQLLDGLRDNVDGLAANYSTDLRYERALTGDLQLGGAFTRTGVAARARDGTFTDAEVLTLFGRMRLGPGVLIAEAVDRLDAGEALGFEYLTGRNGHNVSIAHRRFDDYESPATVQHDALEALTELTATGSFGDYQRSAYRVGIRHRDRVDGPSDIRIYNRVGTRIGALNLSNDLEYSLAPGPDSTSGRFRLASRLRRVSLRGQLDYSVTGKQRLKQVSTTVNWDAAGRLNYNVSVAKRLTDEKELYVTNLLSLRIRDFNLTLSASSNLSDTLSFGVGFSTAFGYDGRRQSFIMHNRDLASSGRATMNLYIDENNNGIRDSGEPPVPWAKYREDETLAMSPGVLPLTPLPGAHAVQIETRHFEFDDPFLVPRAEAYELRTHAGADVSLDVAVVMTGDIEGRVYFGSAENAIAARGVAVSLHAPDGREIDTTLSEFDGFYSFSGIPGGDYEVRASRREGGAPVARPISLDARAGYTVAEGIYLGE